jgi:hypothetical protein
MKRQPDQYHRHEMMDRAHVVSVMMEQLFDGHPALTPELEVLFAKAHEAMLEFYQVAGLQAFGNDEGERTDWFAYDTYPVHEGWYEFKPYCEPVCRLYWNGREWGHWAPYGWTDCLTDHGDQWRGLIKETK